MEARWVLTMIGRALVPAPVHIVQELVDKHRTPSAPARPTLMSTVGAGDTERESVDPGYSYRVVEAGQTGVTYDDLLVPYLEGRTSLTIVDPYIRADYQVRNLRELLGALAARRGGLETVEIHLLTSEVPESEARVREKRMRQYTELMRLREDARAFGVVLGVEFRDDIHDRRIETPDGTVLLGCGLDIWAKPADARDPAQWSQVHRVVKKQFCVVYLPGVYSSPRK